ncbi:MULTISPECIES: hypothetical protein [Pseudomonas]|jgi:hypothetical protein|uniref:hypothetical protein n=1 Tax=Pseudomonas TaxID=286 RepID=UPI0006D3F025|nr:MULTISPECIES: hypothetical protein [Pseudomonas]EKT4542825.1 hypothetical protein [Pseudomonas putida]MCE1055710.1 hypothetical protein [Pseudomonas alloputida]WBM45310.1 hypothetical protein M2J85_21765 [Pseudomonas putida]
MNPFSTSALLQRLSEEDRFFGWGAVMALSRKALNTSLQDHYLQSLGKLTYLEPFDDAFSINEGSEQIIEIEGLVLGAAHVSFEGAVSTDRLVTVRMNLLAGDFRYRLQLAGQPPRLHRSFTIRETQGFYLEAQCKFELRLDPISMKQEIVIDIAQASRYICNLGLDNYERTQIGKRLGQWLVQQNEERRVLKMGSFNLRNYEPLDLRKGALITLPAPWAATPGFEGDGALVVFMQKGVDFKGGNMPSQPYPYPLPNEASTDVMLLTPPIMQELQLGEPADVVRSLALGNDRRVALSETHLLADASVSFGALARGALSREVQPAISTLGAAMKQPFAMSGGSGGVEWQARNLFRPGATGTMNGGLYQATARESFARPTQMILVTGHALDDDESLVASALVVETDKPLTIAPQTVNWSNGDGPIEFVVSGSAAVDWSLEGEELGKLDKNGNKATFTYTAQHTSGIQRQRIRVRYDNEGIQSSAEACVVIVNTAAAIYVEPFHVPRENAQAPIQFSSLNWREALLAAGQTPPATLQEAKIEWTVVGEGEITPDGLYTPPLKPESSASVVMADLMGMAFGYAIVEHGEDGMGTGTRSSIASGWKALSNFTLRTLSAPRCFANGMQQIQVEVSIITEQGDSIVEPIGEDDMRTFGFYLEGGGQLDFVDEGIEPGDKPETWVVRRTKNPKLKTQPGGVRGGAPAEEQGELIRHFWLQTTATQDVTIYAQFKKAGLGGQWQHSQRISHQDGEVKVTGMMRPGVAIEAFDWSKQPVRVEHEGAEHGGDTFSYKTLTVDYWYLKHLTRELNVIYFVEIRVETDDNLSVMRWETEEYEDTLCSYSGYVFGNSKEEMIYDPQLVLMSAHRGVPLKALHPNYAPHDNALMISLTRIINFPFRHQLEHHPDPLYDFEEEVRPTLLRPFKFSLLDQEGNRHYLRVMYVGLNRNHFMLDLQ